MTDSMDFLKDLPAFAQPNWTPEGRRPPALDLISAVNENDELTIMPAMGKTTTEWLTSDYWVEVHP